MIRNVIIKVTLDCDIHCRYCYVQRNREYDANNRLMEKSTLQILIKKISEYIKDTNGANDTNGIDRFVFYWHGGEPLLAGTSFFKESFLLQQKYMPNDIFIVNTIQSNGILLNQEWIDLIKEIGYGICLSLDGPPEINDIWRKTKNGKGTYQSVLNSINLLQKNGLCPSVLSVVTPEALPHGQKIYKHFREIGITWMDFMYPFYSNIDNTLDQSIQPSKWGQFYKDVFDAWIEEGNPDVYIRMLHDICMRILGAKTSMCSFSSDCSYVITVDPSGNIYICDDLLSYDDSLLGNIFSNSLSEINSHQNLARLSRISTLYGDNCLKCNYFSICRGGCTLFRTRKYGDFSCTHYYCQAQKSIIDHIKNYFNHLLNTEPNTNCCPELQVRDKNW